MLLSTVNKYHDFSNNRQLCSLNVIKEYDSPKLPRSRISGNMEKSCSEEKPKTTSNRKPRIPSEEKYITSSESSKKSSKQSGRSNPKRVTQRSLSSFDSSQVLRMNGSRDQRRCSNSNTHYLIEYRKRQRQMSVWYHDNCLWRLFLVISVDT